MRQLKFIRLDTESFPGEIPVAPPTLVFEFKGHVHPRWWYRWGEPELGREALGSRA